MASTFRLTGRFLFPDTDGHARDHVTITPNARVRDTSTGAVHYGPRSYTLGASGALSVDLIAQGVDPSIPAGRLQYTVEAGEPFEPITFTAPAAGTTTSIAKVTPTVRVDRLGVTAEEFEAQLTAYADAIRNDVTRVLGSGAWYDVETTTVKNLWIDPGMTTPTAMTARAGSVSASSSSAGPHYKLTGDGTGAAYMQTAGRPPIPARVKTVWVTLRAYADADRAAFVNILFYKGNSGAGNVATTINHSKTWRTHRFPVTVPADADNLRVIISASGSGVTTPSGSWVVVDDLGVLTDDVPFFTGSTPGEDGQDVDGVEVDVTYSWDGTPNESQSTRTTTTTTAHLGDWVPGTTVASRIRAIEDRLDGIGDGEPGGGTAPGLVAPPPGWPGLTLAETPTVHRTGAGQYVAGVDEDVARAEYVTGTPVYVSPTGGGDGSSRTSPTTLAAALASRARRIHLMAGEHRAPGLTPTTHDYALVAVDPGVTITGYHPTPTWTARGDGAYAAPVSSASATDNQPAHDTGGLHATYARAASAAEVTGPGMWHSDGSTTTVWPLGGTNLTSKPDAVRLTTGQSAGINQTGGTVWAEGIAFEGAGLASTDGTTWLVDCTIRYGHGNGWSANGGMTWAIRSDASGNWLDGWNYHQTKGTPCEFAEVDCTGRRNGQGSKRGNCNGSTAHEAVVGLRVGGHYGDTFGPVLADVNDAQTWTIGATTERTTAAMSTLPHVHCDGSASTGPMACMWVQDHTTRGLGTSWKASTGATVRLRSEHHGATSLMDAATGTVTREW